MTDLALKLTGTAEIEPPHRLLRAGDLTATLDGGGLRWVKWRGTEILRGLGFLVRNAGWGTPAIAMADLHVVETADGFGIAYEGAVQDGDARLDIRVSIKGRADGSLVAHSEVIPRTDFVTNRTGFVVLHPIEGFVGSAVTVEHGDGGTETREIAPLISPGQPVRDIRGLSYSPRPGLLVRVRFEGEIFEMEDQRNWTDASFKTYSRPLDWPRPYTLRAGEAVTQSVIVRVHDDAPSRASDDASDAPVRVTLGGKTTTRLPRIGLVLPSDLAVEALPHARFIARTGLDHLAIRYDLSDPRRGALADAARLAAAVDLPVTLDILLTAEEDPRPELVTVAAQAVAAGLRPVAVGAYPKVDEISFQPGEARPPSPSFAAIHAAVRSAFPGASVVGGTPAFFTELNRKQPDLAGVDVVSHGTCAIVHAADDRSVIETLQSLPWIIRSARAFSDGRRLRLGPVAIGARINPYGSSPEKNPSNCRVGLTGLDPRQRGLFAAAWHIGYAAATAPHGIDSLVFAAPTGPFGLVHTRTAHPQPPFDNADDGAVYPLFHAVAALARGSGKPLIETLSTDCDRVAALAWREGEGLVLLLANLTAEPQRVDLDADAAHLTRLRVLDAKHFDQATRDPLLFASEGRSLDGQLLVLGPYATAALTLARKVAEP